MSDSSSRLSAANSPPASGKLQKPIESVKDHTSGETALSNFGDLCRSLGKAIAKDFGTSLKWVDLHASNPDMRNYQQYQIRVEVTNVHYSDNTNVTPMPGFTFEDQTKNYSDKPVKTVFKKSHETTTSFTWSLTEAIELGMSVEFEVGVPPIASAKTTLSAKISVSSTQAKTETEKETWSIDKEVTTSPHYEGKMKWTIVQKKYDATFYADVNIMDYVAFWFNHKIDLNNKGGNDKHWLWFLHVSNIWPRFSHYGISVSPQYSSNGNAILYHNVGRCSGHEGVNSYFEYREEPLPDQMGKIPVAVAAEMF